MKTILDKTHRDELIARTATLDENCAAQWGKMHVYEMILHCSTWDEQVLNNVPLKHSFIGRLFGKFALKKMLKDEAPLDKNVPTSTHLKFKATGDLRAARDKWMTRMQDYANYTTPEYMHDFFGRMSREEVGRLAYKHTDHHLRQFGR